MKEICCETMEYWSTNHCPVHDSPFECPDWLVLFDEKSNEYGMIIHDGGQSVVTIHYCPWCGASLGPKPRPGKKTDKGLP
ncbi:MAG: hypothetical protein IJK35_04810 [Oscillospiraceae bacterium]|nr:hypothetical protein [Oscillospiraceae bacterium]